MIRTITVGMTLELTNPINHAPYHVRVTALPTEEGGKYTVVNINSGKEKQLSLAAISTARRYKIPATKGPTVVSSALAVLTKENKPMTVAEISAAILQGGYTPPREGKTFSCTVSSRLNKACADGLIKKLCTGVFAANDCTVEYKKPANSAAAKKAEREAQSAAVVEELAAQLAD